MIFRNLLLFAALSTCGFAGTITQVSTRLGLGADDFANWGVAADDGVVKTSPYAVTSNLGLTVTGTHTGDFIIWQNGTTFVANFGTGDILLDTNFLNGPISIAFSSAIRGAGFNIINDNIGAFTGSLSFYGAGNLLFDTVTVNGSSSLTADGSAPFLGGTSSLRDIVRIDISVSSVLGGTPLAINQIALLTTDPAIGVPEPGTSVLVSGALAGLLYLRRRR